jgi:hypothetical protein
VPFKSKAQIRKFYQLKAEGKMSQETIDQWMAETPNPKKLPNRVKPKKKAKFAKGFKKVASPVLADEALQDSRYSMQDRVPGGKARETMETGQPRKGSTRTQGVKNEDKQFGSIFRRKAQTARGGHHYGGTIREGFSEDSGNDSKSFH